ncbi:hypothetical protein IWQ62_003731 [Dispira parvispora]|uniref:EIF3F/CSN6-like C-terminal domain-containing protein n=1 Tax=Dispira parvispora TaxID=1520584 RepID=A0A9W8ATM9_9FUNG|nr:hypothetical protein IWQ62_003731 [Dispira parvispora]
MTMSLPSPGALSNDPHIHISSPVSLRESSIDGDATPLVQHQSQRVDLLKQMYPDYQVLGWYCPGAHITEEIITLYKQFDSEGQRPLIVMMDHDALASSSSTTMPIQIYQPLPGINNGLSQVDPTGNTWSPLPFTITSDPTECHVTDHLLHQPNHDENQTVTLLRVLRSHRNALSVFQQQLSAISNYLSAVRSHQGSTPDPALLRQIASLVQAFPPACATLHDTRTKNHQLQLAQILRLSTLVKSSTMVRQLTEKIIQLDNQATAPTAAHMARRKLRVVEP